MTLLEVCELMEGEIDKFLRLSDRSGCLNVLFWVRLEAEFGKFPKGWCVVCCGLTGERDKGVLLVEDWLLS